MSQKSCVIVGAGLVGSLLALYLRRSGFDVTIFEGRPDMRKSSMQGGRSINLVVTSRGLCALKEIDALDHILPITEKVFGRFLHQLDGSKMFQPYGQENDCNYSVSRSELNKELLNLAEKSGAEIYFNHAVSDVDFDHRVISFKNGKSFSFNLLFGADGSFSMVRHNLLSFLEKRGLSVENSMVPLGSSYKELLLSDVEKSSSLLKSALHIWPRGSHMLMALPNKDGSFTCTFYFPDHKINELDSPLMVEKFFLENYQDIPDLIPDYLAQFQNNPTSGLQTIHCFPWSYGARVCLIGDAAHGIAPFFGQGMNAGFEDCIVLNKLLTTYGSDLDKVFHEFQSFQKINTKAIAEMALENFVEMKEKVGDASFLLRKKVEKKLETWFPGEFCSRYVMVTYTLIPYGIIQEFGVIQNEILDLLCHQLNDLAELDKDKAEILIREKLAPFRQKKNISLAKYIVA